MDTDAIILNKTLANQIQEFTERIIHQVGLIPIPRVQGWFNIYKSIIVIRQLSRMKNKKCIISKDVKKKDI